MEKQKLALIHVNVTKATRKEKSTVMPRFTIRFYWISRLNIVFDTAKERNGLCAKFMSNVSTVIVSCSKVIIPFY